MVMSSLSLISYLSNSHRQLHINVEEIDILSDRKKEQNIICLFYIQISSVQLRIQGYKFNVKVIIFDTPQDFWEISAEFMYHAVLGGMARAAGDDKVSRIRTFIFSLLCSVPYLVSWQALNFIQLDSLCVYMKTSG